MMVAIPQTTAVVVAAIEFKIASMVVAVVVVVVVLMVGVHAIRIVIVSYSCKPMRDSCVCACRSATVVLSRAMVE